MAQTDFFITHKLARGSKSPWILENNGHLYLSPPIPPLSLAVVLAVPLNVLLLVVAVGLFLLCPSSSFCWAPRVSSFPQHVGHPTPSLFLHYHFACFHRVWGQTYHAYCSRLVPRRQIQTSHWSAEQWWLDMVQWWGQKWHISRYDSRVVQETS